MFVTELDKMARVAQRKGLTEITVRHGAVGEPELTLTGISPVTGATFIIVCQKVNGAYEVLVTKKPAPTTTTADEELV